MSEDILTQELDKMEYELRQQINNNTQQKSVLLLKFNNYDIIYKKIDLDNIIKLVDVKIDLINKKFITSSGNEIFMYNGEFLFDDSDLTSVNKSILCFDLTNIHNKKFKFNINNLQNSFNSMMSNIDSDSTTFNISDIPIMNMLQNMMSSMHNLSSDTENYTLKEEKNVISNEGSVAKEDDNLELKNSSIDKSDSLDSDKEDETDNTIVEISNNNENEDVEIDMNNEYTNSLQEISSQLINSFNNSFSEINYENIREKYKEQYDTLISMGFNNKDRILQSLEICDGDIEASINYYLSSFDQ